MVLPHHETRHTRNPIPNRPDKSIRRGFAKYVAYAEANHVSMHPELRAAVELMKMLDDHGCSTALYNKIMSWHMQNYRQKQ